jgi:hypothetical protein
MKLEVFVISNHCMNETCDLNFSFILGGKCVQTIITYDQNNKEDDKFHGKEKTKWRYIFEIKRRKEIKLQDEEIETRKKMKQFPVLNWKPYPLWLLSFPTPTPFVKLKLRNNERQQSPLTCSVWILRCRLSQLLQISRSRAPWKKRRYRRRRTKKERERQRNST